MRQVDRFSSSPRNCGKVLQRFSALCDLSELRRPTLGTPRDAEGRLTITTQLIFHEDSLRSFVLLVQLVEGVCKMLLDALCQVLAIQRAATLANHRQRQPVQDIHQPRTMLSTARHATVTDS